MNNNGKGGIYIVIIAIVIFLLAAGSCDGESDYEKNMKSGWNKWSTGDYGSMTDNEKEAVNDFLKWANEN